MIHSLEEIQTRLQWGMLKDLVKKCEVGQWSGSMRVALDDMVKSFNDAMTQAMECCVPLVPEKAIAEEGAWRQHQAEKGEEPVRCYTSGTAKSQGGSSVPPFEDLEGNMCSSDIEKAEGFNEAYAKIGNEPDGENKVGGKVPDIFSAETLKVYVHKLRDDMGPGGDGVTNVLIKRLPDVALAYLAKLFHLLFAAGTCPDYWRKVLLFPISKGKEIVSALHLRPIALTAAVGKLFERRQIDYGPDHSHSPKAEGTSL
eukprot:CAMPEP_0167812474 /NCGR_PEP_ID=MMETSP0112_2-20121227/1275_1 /TAXON_ID=91324 /ORGANISM="Lotharella globosa, Strain CCCM811" /LENGTH=255 /DNA_ID=CAMNT_0007711363 /DNA_START=1204 /DNA_END=1972 /DNA_ORIENTATION=-